MSSRRRVGLVAGAVIAVQLAAFLVYRAVEGRRDAGEFRSETLAAWMVPDLAFERRDGSTQRLADLRGRRVLLHFWATWCPPCRHELPRLLEFGRRYGREHGIDVVAVSLDTDWAKVEEFFDHEIPGEVVRDAGKRSVEAFHLTTLPDTYLIAADGSMQLRFFGERDWTGPRAREALEGHSRP